MSAASKGSAALLAGRTIFGSIEKALAIPAARVLGTIEDVQHVVILMQENRSFDHYFGTMNGVRGFGDRHAIQLPSGKPVWYQSDGEREILPFHLDTQTTTAMRVPGTPHSWPDAQAAWADGRFGFWPQYKFFQSMGYYKAQDIPFQRALADAFTLCDAHHCSVQTGTLANRVVFMTGTNVEPGTELPQTDQKHALIDNANNRGGVHGFYRWTTYPERLQEAGISWRIYQDPQQNWGGLLAPWESFEQYANAQPGDPLYENAMRAWSLTDLRSHVQDGSLPQVSWIVPSPVWSEHPAQSSPLQGASFVQQVLDILVSNPELWSKTVFLVTFDENDGFFDHVPPPAPPAYDLDDKLAGATTLPGLLGGEYYTDNVFGRVATRPYGMGPRVPLFAISPWSRGGWVCSQVFDHTSTIRFLEARFGVMEPNISAWRRAVSGDLTRCFNFADPNLQLPVLPDMSEARAETLVLEGNAPSVPVPQALPVQDTGLRYSRALPYELYAQLRYESERSGLRLEITNRGEVGAVLHLYDRVRPERVPQRYTVESGKHLHDELQPVRSQLSYDLQLLGPNGFVRQWAGPLDGNEPEVFLLYRPKTSSLELRARTRGPEQVLLISPSAYPTDVELRIRLPQSGAWQTRVWSVAENGNWYDFTLRSSLTPTLLYRYAGRLETGEDGVTDPALGTFRS